MKTYLAAFIIMITVSANAQEVHPLEEFLISDARNVDNVYFKDVNSKLNKFLGVWTFSDGSKFVTIAIRKQTKVEIGLSTTGVRQRTKRLFVDQIVVDFEYKINGNIIYHVIAPYQMVNGEPLYSNIFGMDLKTENSIDLNYDEPSTTSCDRQRSGILILTFVPGTQNHLTWERSDKAIILPADFCEGGTFDNSPYQMPANMTFVKLN